MKFISLVCLPIFFILLSEASAEEYIDYRLVPEVAETQGRRVARAVNSKCKEPGPICQDCKNIHFCDNQNASSLLWTCGEKETCDNGACTTLLTPQCSPLLSSTFICNGEGIFPDPADCFKYHYCIQPPAPSSGPKLIDYPRSCQNDTTSFYSYNTKTSYCDKKLASEVCTGYPVPVCNRPAQNAALVDNPSMYYICKMYTSVKPNPQIILYPYLYICENGKTYNNEKFQCTSGPLTATSSSTAAP